MYSNIHSQLETIFCSQSTYWYFFLEARGKQKTQRKTTLTQGEHAEQLHTDTKLRSGLSHGPSILLGVLSAYRISQEQQKGNHNTKAFKALHICVLTTLCQQFDTQDYTPKCPCNWPHSEYFQVCSHVLPILIQTTKTLIVEAFIVLNNLRISVETHRFVGCRQQGLGTK